MGRAQHEWNSAGVVGVILGSTRAARSTRISSPSDYWQGKMLEHYAAYRPFRELDDAIGIAQDDWWMTDERGQRKSFMKMWLDHVGDKAFNLAAEPKPEDFATDEFPGSYGDRVLR